jgi:hypothetical protein
MPARTALRHQDHAETWSLPQAEALRCAACWHVNLRSSAASSSPVPPRSIYKVFQWRALYL